MIALPQHASIRPGPELLAMGFHLSPIGGHKRGVRIRETHNETPGREKVTKNNSVAVLKAELKELGKQTDALLSALNTLVGEKKNASKKGRPKGSKNKKKAEAVEAGSSDQEPQPKKSRAKKEEKQPVEA